MYMLNFLNILLDNHHLSSEPPFDTYTLENVCAVLWMVFSVVMDIICIEGGYRQ